MLVKIFKQLVVPICLVSILFSSPAVALASQNIEVHTPKGDWNITEKIYDSGNTGTSIIASAIIDDTNFFRIQNLQIGEVVGLIVGRIMAVPAELIAIQESNHAITSHKQENDVSTKSLSIEKY